MVPASSRISAYVMKAGVAIFAMKVVTFILLLFPHAFALK